MIRKTFAWLLVSGLACSAAWAQSADDVVAKHIQAMGGIEKIKAVQSVRLTGKMNAQGMELPFTTEIVRPNKVRTEFTVQGMTGIQAFDGEKGWMLMPFMGKKDPEEMPSEQLKRMQDEADIDGILVDYKAKGSTLELLGKEDLEGSPAYKLRMTKKNGDVLTLFVDAETHLLLKQIAKMNMMGQEVEGETVFGSFKEVGGMMFPHSMESKAAGQPGAMSMTIDKVELNPTIDTARFSMPKVEKPAAPAPPKQ
jgi:outer membrane lipoprotein-sorting protein